MTHTTPVTKDLGWFGYTFMAMLVLTFVVSSIAVVQSALEEPLAQDGSASFTDAKDHS